MSQKPHDLAVEFAQDREVLHRLKAEGGHFATLAERYTQVNEEIYKIEAGLEASSDPRAEELKKERLSLLDELGGLIREAKAETA